MAVKININKDILTVYLIGDIDHHTAKGMRETTDINIDTYNPKTLIMDFKDVPFMDTSGIGLVMGRYKIMRSIGGQIKIVNLSPHLKRIMSLAGLNKLAHID